VQQDDGQLSTQSKTATPEASEEASPNNNVHMIFGDKVITVQSVSSSSDSTKNTEALTKQTISHGPTTKGLESSNLFASPKKDDNEER
jgi:hypothetical protein